MTLRPNSLLKTSRVTASPGDANLQIAVPGQLPLQPDGEADRASEPREQFEVAVDKRENAYCRGGRWRICPARRLLRKR
jgi:hypothetical protein